MGKGEGGEWGKVGNGGGGEWRRWEVCEVGRWEVELVRSGGWERREGGRGWWGGGGEEVVGVVGGSGRWRGEVGDMMRGRWGGRRWGLGEGEGEGGRRWGLGEGGRRLGVRGEGGGLGGGGR